MRLGIAAEDVVAVTPETWDEDVHIASILGVAPVDGGERRTIRLPNTNTESGLPGICSFQADMPLDVIECETEHILPMPAGMPPDMWRPVMGFVELSQTITLLLDIPSVVAALLERYRRRPS